MENLPIPVLPVIFLRISFLFCLYITIYILISYRIYKKRFGLEIPFLEYWKNWNIGRFWFRLFPAFPPKSPLPLESLDSVLSVITLAANAEQLVGGSSAEFLEGEKLLELRSAVEGRVERTVFLAVHVDVSSFIHVWISLHHLLLLLGVVLHECEVVFAVVRNGSVQILAHGHASRLACYQLEVDTQLCVGVESLFFLAGTFVHIAI